MGKATNYLKSKKELKFVQFPKTYEDSNGYERQVMGEVEYKPFMTPEGEQLEDYKEEPTIYGLALYMDMTIEELITSDDKEIKRTIYAINDRLERNLRIQGKVEDIKKLLEV